MPELAPFDRADAEAVAGWVTSLDEAANWASLDHLPDAATVAGWHVDPEVVPFVARADGRLVGYGEVWEDHEEDEAELARLIVAPEERGRGLGRWLARALAHEAQRRGLGDVWLRVVPENVRALRAYAAAGFVRTDPTTEASFNAGQPATYAWLHDELGG